MTAHDKQFLELLQGLGAPIGNLDMTDILVAPLTRQISTQHLGTKEQ